MLAAALALLFFAPLAFLYGRTVAAGIHARADAGRASRLALGLRRLVLPGILALCLALRFADPGTVTRPSSFYTGNGVVDALVSLALIAGSLASLLFFLTVPFILGRLFGVGAALAGYFREASPHALRFGLRRGANAPEKAGGGEAAVATTDEERTGMGLTIAIDGPAASGKGTLARRIAARYGLAHLDTGLTYRAVAKALLDAGQPLDDELLALRAAERLDLTKLDRAALSAHAVGEAASRVAVMPLVRRSLVEAQRRFAERGEGAVLDGRDIGTVVLPGAEVKLFVTASGAARARRRHAEVAGAGGADSYEAILADLERRDRRDSTRTDSPLRPAADAHLLDTSEMDIEAAFRAACDLIDRSRS